MSLSNLYAQVYTVERFFPETATTKAYVGDTGDLNNSYITYWDDNIKANGLSVMEFNKYILPIDVAAEGDKIEDEYKNCIAQWNLYGCLQLKESDTFGVIVEFSNDSEIFPQSSTQHAATLLAVTKPGDKYQFAINTSASSTPWNYTKIVLNGRNDFPYTWTTTESNIGTEFAPIKAMLLHEMGHLIGLGHIYPENYGDDNPTVMASNRVPNHYLFSLTDDDNQALQQLCTLNGTPTGIEDDIEISTDVSYFNVNQIYVGHNTRMFIDRYPYNDYITNWDNWSITASYGCGSKEVFNTDANGYIYIPTLPSGYKWDRDENGYVMGTLSTGGTDNSGIHHFASMPIKIGNAQNTFITSGTLTLDTTFWCGNIDITGNITIPPTKKLRIFPGAHINFANNATLIVQGSLEAVGCMFDFISPNSSSQNGIKIEYGGNAYIEDAYIKDAWRGIYTADREPIINKTTFEDCYYGIYLDNTNYGGYEQPTITNNTILGSDIGIVMYTSSPYIRGNEIYNCRIGVGCAEQSSPYLGDVENYGKNNIHDNDYGLYAYSYSDPFLGRQSCLVIGGKNSFTNYSRAIYLRDYCDVTAENNWWGTPYPGSSIFSITNSTLDYSPYLSSPPDLNLSIHNMSSSPEEQQFNKVFKKDVVNSSINTTDNVITQEKVNEQPSSYNNNWPLRWKLYYVKNLIDVRKISLAQKICKEIISENPDSTLSIHALNLLWRASTQDDSMQFINFLNKIAKLKMSSDLNDLAQLILAGYNQNFYEETMNTVIKNSAKSEIIKSALLRKFIHVLNNDNDRSKARSIMLDIDNKYPDSFISEEAHNLFGDNSGGFNKAKQTQTNSENIELIPQRYSLLGNYPNPFNPTTFISYDLPRDSRVEIVIYDMLGKVVKEFTISSQSAGSQRIQWDATNNNGEKVTSGIYLYHFKATALEGNNEIFEKSSKLILMK